MASKPHLVLLGYIDEQITSKTQHVNFTATKVGGTPDWCVSGCEIPICKRCGRKQSLVVQLYSPLEGSPYHRTLYILACVTQECWNRPQSWTCLRSQLLDPTLSRASNTTKSSPAKVGETPVGETWFDDEDDWGTNDNDGNGNADTYNFASSSQMYLDNMAKKSDGGSNLNNLNSNTSSITDITKSLESKLSIIEGDANANETVCGAVGIVGCGGEGLEASAVIEGSEEDMIAVDTPEQPTSDIPALFQEAAQIDANAEVSFIPYFVSSDVEPAEDVSFTDHERELLVRYTHSTGHDFMEEQESGGAEGKDGIYEKDVAIHGDVLLHKFKKRISRSPQQILRYCREEGASPLWLRPPGQSDIATKCQYCGGAMVFELQLTPQLIIQLRVPGVPGTALEFGTVAVYTCLASCWAEKDTLRQEATIVQNEMI